MLTVEKSSIVSPALGWMLFIVAATTVSKLWFVSRVLKKKDNLAASTKWSGQWSITANSFVPKIRSSSGIHPSSHMVKFWSCAMSTINWCWLSLSCWLRSEPARERNSFCPFLFLSSDSVRKKKWETSWPTCWKSSRELRRMAGRLPCLCPPTPARPPSSWS